MAEGRLASGEKCHEKSWRVKKKWRKGEWGKGKKWREGDGEW